MTERKKDIICVLAAFVALSYAMISFLSGDLELSFTSTLLSGHGVFGILVPAFVCSILLIKEDKVDQRSLSIALALCALIFVLLHYFFPSLWFVIPLLAAAFISVAACTLTAKMWPRFGTFSGWGF